MPFASNHFSCSAATQWHVQNAQNDALNKHSSATTNTYSIIVICWTVVTRTKTLSKVSVDAQRKLYPVMVAALSLLHLFYSVGIKTWWRQSKTCLLQCGGTSVFLGYLWGSTELSESFLNAIHLAGPFSQISEEQLHSIANLNRQKLSVSGLKNTAQHKVWWVSNTFSTFSKPLKGKIHAVFLAEAEVNSHKFNYQHFTVHFCGVKEYMVLKGTLEQENWNVTG